MTDTSLPRDAAHARRKLVAGLGAAAIASLTPLGASRAWAQDAPWATVTAAAAKEGKVIFYHNLNSTSEEAIGKEFRKDVQGIDIQFVRLTSAAFMQRFSTEFTANRNGADLVLTTADPGFFDGIKAGWAQAWVPPELKPYPAGINYNSQNLLFNVLSVRNVIVWNTQRVRPAETPKEWADLFDARWKGKVGMNPPWRAVSQQALIAYWEKLGLGDTAAKAKANDVRFFEGSAGLIQAVIRGDVYIAQMLDLPVEPTLADGAPIGFVYPKSGTTVSPLYLFVPARSARPNAAKVVANWLMSAKGQAALQTYGGMAGTRPGIPAMAYLPSTSSLSNVQDSLELASPAKQKEIVEQWRKTFGVQ